MSDRRKELVNKLTPILEEFGVCCFFLTIFATDALVPGECGEMPMRVRTMQGDIIGLTDEITSLHVHKLTLMAEEFLKFNKVIDI